MSEIITFKLPDGSSVESAKSLETGIKQIAGVSSAGVQQTRGAEAIMVWVGLAKPVMDVVTKIIEFIKGKGLTGVEIQLPNHVTLKVDSASPADIERLLKALREAS